MDLIGDVSGAEGVDLLRSAGTPADIDATYGALFAQDGSAAGDGAEIGYVSDANSGNIGKSFHGCAFSFYGSIGVRGSNLLAGSAERACSRCSGVFLACRKGPEKHFSTPALRRRHHPSN